MRPAFLLEALCFRQTIPYFLRWRSCLMRRPSIMVSYRKHSMRVWLETPVTILGLHSISMNVFTFASFWTSLQCTLTTVLIAYVKRFEIESQTQNTASSTMEREAPKVIYFIHEIYRDKMTRNDQHDVKIGITVCY